MVKSNSSKSPRASSRSKITRYIPSDSTPPKSSKSRQNRVQLTDPLVASKACLLCMVCICALSIVAVFIVDLCFNPKRDAVNTINELAKDYYTDILYPNTLGSQLDDPASVLSKHAKTGLPTVYLRQLLYSDPSKTSLGKFIINDYYRCDTNRTSLRYFPVEPYGPSDYRVDINYSCESLREID